MYQRIRFCFPFNGTHVKAIALLYLFCCYGRSSLQAQFYALPSDYVYQLKTDARLLAGDTLQHCSFKPLIPGFNPTLAFQNDSSVFFRSTRKPKLNDALFNQHLIRLRSSGQDAQFYDLFLDPILNLEAGQDLADANNEALYTNTRGLIAGGRLGKNLYFETLFSENQSFFPHYIDSFAQYSKVIPGQGRWKNFKTTGYDYAFASGLISMQAGRHVNIQLGHGKQKIGEGYRTLFLSDNAFNYPYLRITQQWFKGRLQYTNLYSLLMNLSPAYSEVPVGTEALFQKNPAAFQHLSVNLWNRLNLGLFQGMLWNGADGQNRQSLDFGYFNPFILTNIPVYGFNHPKHNIILGTELNLRISRSLQVYGQLVLDDPNPPSLPSAEGWAYMGGLRYFNAFGIKNLVLQSEYIHGAEAVYANQNGLSYQHYNQNLATPFPFGQELVGLVSYTFKRFYVNARFHYQSREEYTVPQVTGSFPAYQTTLVQGRFGYVLNPAYNLCLYVSGLSRLQKINTFNVANQETAYLSFGLKTGIYNLYYDF